MTSKLAYDAFEKSSLSQGWTSGVNLEAPSRDWHWMDEKYGYNLGVKHIGGSSIWYISTCPICAKEYKVQATGVTTNKDLVKMVFRLGVILSRHMEDQHGVVFDEGDTL